MQSKQNNNMLQKSGRVYQKNEKYGILGKKKYFVTVQFDQSYDRSGQTTYEYRVDEDMYNSVILGSRVTSQFAQVPEGMKPLYLC